MFAARYFPGHYFPVRYFTPSGAQGPPPGPGGGYWNNYFAPSYFPARYFPSSAHPAPATAAGGYWENFFAPNYYPPRYFPSLASLGPLATDLIAAILIKLESSPSLVTAFGHSPATPKFWLDKVQGSPDKPYLKIESPQSNRSYVWGSFKYTEAGLLQMTIVAETESRARSLGWMIAGNTSAGMGILDDPTLLFSEGSLRFFRLVDQFYLPTESVGVASPTFYQRVLLFDYKFSGRSD